MKVSVGQAHRDFTIFVDVQRILHHLPRTPTVAVAWQTWGEDATRWIEAPRLSSYSIPSFYGSRFVTGQCTSDDHQIQLVVADFNPMLVKKINARESVGSSLDHMKNKSLKHNTWPQLAPNLEERRMLVDCVDEETPTVVEGFTETPIVSRLPYRVAVVGGPSVTHQDWMIDENRLIRLK
ncbi:hypothetical protein FRC10_008778, partial [Ceratobasidium sp. 414]